MPPGSGFSRIAAFGTAVKERAERSLGLLYFI